MIDAHVPALEGKTRPAAWTAVIGTLALIAGLVSYAAGPAAPPARADNTGYNNFVTLNPSGGNSASDGLRIVVSSGAYGIWRNGRAQVYGASSAAGLQGGNYPLNSIMLALDDDTLVSYAGGTSGGATKPAAWGASEASIVRMSWLSAETTLDETGVTTPGLWQATTTLVADVDRNGTGDDSLVVTTTYQVPDDTALLTYTLHRTTTSDYRLYHGVDMYLDGDDYGPGTTSVVDGRRIVAQYNNTGVGGFRQALGASGDDTAWASYMEGYYRCPFGYGDASCADSPYGPYNASRYPNTVNPARVDSGVGIEFNLGSGAGSETAKSEFYFAKRPGVVQGRFTNASGTRIASVATNETVYLTLTLSSPSGVDTNGLGFTLRIPGGAQGVRAGATTVNTCSGTATRGPGTGSVDDSYVMSGINVSGGASCTIRVPISGFQGVPGVDYQITDSDVTGLSVTSPSPLPLMDINDQVVVEGKRYDDSNPKIINAVGGLPGSGLKITYGAGQVQIIRNTVNQLYSPQQDPKRYIQPELFNGYFLLVDDTLVGTKSAWPDDDAGWVAYPPGVSGDSAIINWDSVTASGGSTRGSGTIESTLTYNAPGGRTYTLKVELIYDASTSTPTSDRVRERLTLTVPTGHSQDDTIKLYRAMDTYLNGVDFGSGFADDSTAGAPRKVGALSADNAVKQWLQAVDDTLWDGWYANTFACPVNPDYDDPAFGSCLSLDDSDVNAIVAGGNLWDDTTATAIATSTETDMSLAVMWDVDDTIGTYTYAYDIWFEDLPGAPDWVTQTLPAMAVGTPLTTTVVATPNTDDSHMLYEVVAGSLPSGLELNREDGEITGTPTQSGTYEVVMEATNAVGASAYQTFTGSVAGQPTPAPTFPPSKPLDVVAVPGNGSATVTWSPPASSGSFPVTDYRVTAGPGGATCLVKAPATTCTVEGLTNGTAYTFVVEALNGAGWSPPSDPSNAVTPSAGAQPTIVITGTRTREVLTITGTTTGIAPQTRLTPNVSLAGGPFEAGANIRELGEDERFDWTRRVLRGREAAVYFSDGAVRSNTLEFPAAPAIVITGTRSGERVAVSGTTTDMRASTRLTPMIGLNGGPVRAGDNLRPVGRDEAFTWKRRVLVTKTLTVYFTDGTVRSNTLTLRP